MKKMGGGVFVYIDAANLKNGTAVQGFDLDYQKFFVWLTEKYHAARVYYFVGYLPNLEERYQALSEIGYRLIFKEVVFNSGKPKGNCDADLVVRAMQDFYEGICKSVVLVSSDGDFVPLIKFLVDHEALQRVVSPAEPNKCSILIKRLQIPITYMRDIMEHIVK